MINKLSVLIPTYNRSEYLKRQLNYFALNKFRGHLIILDSSDGDQDLYLEAFKQQLAIEYYKLSSTTSLISKFNFGIQKVKTEYSVFCADDDFLILPTVLKGLSFLEENDDYSVVHGQYKEFIRNNKRVIVTKGWSYTTPTYCEDDSKDKRVYDYLENYTIPTFYAIQRTEAMKKCYQLTDKYSSDVRFGEMLPAIFSVIQGKIKVFDDLYMIRERMLISSGSNMDPWEHIVSSDEFEDKVSAFVTGILEMDKTSTKSKQTNLSEEKLRSITIVKAHQNARLQEANYRKKTKGQRFSVRKYLRIVLSYLRLHWILQELRSLSNCKDITQHKQVLKIIKRLA